MKQVTLPAPAKLNLFLHITGRREDGYHLLQTVFQFVDFGDELTFTLREDGDDGHIRRVTDLPGVPEESDLVVRAAKLLQDYTGSNSSGQGVDIQVDKRLPMGGGLGGGSSDAATTLLALNYLWQCGLNEDELAKLGLQLGADVPVFVRGRAAWAEGVGEELTPVELPEPWFLVLIPPVNVETAKIFSSSQLRRDCSAITIRDFLAAPMSQNWHNVMQPLVTGQFPEVANALAALNEYAPARMTGSGACVFAAFDNEAAAQHAMQELAQRGWRGFTGKGLNRSPALTVLDNYLSG